MSLKDDPIASDPALLWTWTRIVIALVAILAFAVGASNDQIDLSSIVGP
jgi:hypothetical protein